jgi:protein-L-isoaspartate(D-aspartate) O-methyltransferase
VLSRLTSEVITIERYRTLANKAKATLADLGYNNIEVVIGDGLAGVPDKAPYDRIILTAATDTVPQTLLDQLANDGIMLLPLGPPGGAQRLVKLTKSPSGIVREDLISVRFVPLLPGRAQEL